MATKAKKRKKGSRKSKSSTGSAVKQKGSGEFRSEASKKDQVTSGTKLGFIGRAIQFLKEVKVEFEKITWPSRKETVALTISVLGFTFFLTMYLGVVDISLSKLVRLLIY